MTEKTVKKLIQAAGIFADPAAGPTIALFMNIYDFRCGTPCGTLEFFTSHRPKADRQE